MTSATDAATTACEHRLRPPNSPLRTECLCSSMPGGGPTVEDWYETLDLVTAGTVTPPPIGETVGVHDLAEAFERARSTDAPVRIVYTTA
ncbi:hypothetical protein [Nocardia rhamnosiphila]